MLYLFATTINIENHLDQISPIQDLGLFVSNSSALLLTVATLASFVFFVYGGLRWTLAGGDKAKIEDARNMITGAIIGLAITASVWAIYSLVDYFLGLNMFDGGTSSPTQNSVKYPAQEV